MKQLLRILLCSVAATICINWSGDYSTESGPYKKQEVNFYGTVITKQGTTLSVENISISNLFKKISAYEVQDTAKAERKIDNNKTYIRLSQNPHTDTDSVLLDLEEIKEISIPEPDTIYTYRPKVKNRAPKRTSEYIKIDVISNNPKKTKHSYLIEHKKQLFFEEKNDAGAIEHKLPLLGLKKLIIDGHTKREKESTNSKNKRPKKKIAATADGSRPTQIFKPSRD